MSRPPRGSGSEELRVRIGLLGGARYTVALAADSPLLHQLCVAMEGGAASRGGRGFALSIEGGRGEVYFDSRKISQIEILPAAEAPPRRLEDFEALPPTAVFDSFPIEGKPGFQEIRREVEPLREDYQRRRHERRRHLRARCEALRRERFVVCAAHREQLPLLRNWIASCDHHGIDIRSQALFFPLDAASEAAARELGLHSFADEAALRDAPWEPRPRDTSKHSSHYCVAKIATVQDMLELGYEILFQDPDLVWLEDCLTELSERASRERLDGLFMRDLRPTLQPLYCSAAFGFLRSTECTRYAWDQLQSRAAEIAYVCSEAQILNNIMSCLTPRGLRTARLPDRYVDESALLAAAAGGETLPRTPAVVQTSTSGELAAKIAVLKTQGLWYLED